VPETSPLPAEPEEEEEEDPQVDEFVANFIVTPKSVINVADKVG